MNATFALFAEATGQLCWVGANVHPCKFQILSANFGSRHSRYIASQMRLDIMYGPAAPQGTRIKLEVGYMTAQSRIEGQVMNRFSKYVGLDVHQETIAVSVADTGAVCRRNREHTSSHCETGYAAQAGHCSTGVLLRSRSPRLHDLPAIVWSQFCPRNNIAYPNHFLEDRIGGRGPYERPAVLVVLLGPRREYRRLRI
ncbi:hypothetical protein OKW49_006241 [Paraburkholderia youngii]